MDATFKRNYQNKIKILKQQITSLVDVSANGHSFRQKLQALPKKKHDQVLSLIKLRKQLKHQLIQGKPLEVSVTYSRVTQVTFFHPTATGFKKMQQASNKKLDSLARNPSNKKSKKKANKSARPQI